jgi:hypothetical protein
MRYTWTDSSGALAIDLDPEDIEYGAQFGDCEPYVTELRRVPYIREQLDALDPEMVREELREYGAWDADELADDDFNLTRLLWLACGQASDELVMQADTPNAEPLPPTRALTATEPRDLNAPHFIPEDFAV